MKVVTIENVPGFTITEIKGLVLGISIRSRNFVGTWAGGVKANFGGDQTGYENLVKATRASAMASLISNAEEMGANAVIGIRFDSGQFDSGQQASMAEVVAYGTAVVVEKI
jgi:uncharacterized protein YbjQ (UPF0145 family)